MHISIYVHTHVKHTCTLKNIAPPPFVGHPLKIPCALSDLLTFRADAPSGTGKHPGRLSVYVRSREETFET